MNTLLNYPDGNFRFWLLSQIYMGPDITPTGDSVPNVDDLVLDYNSGLYRVISVDTEGEAPTFTPVLQEFNLNNVQSSNNILAKALSGYQPAASQRAFYDGSISPKTVTIDDRYRVNGTDAVTAKLFKGTDTSSNGIVISRTFNAQGNVTGENLTLELLDVTNPAIKRPEVITVNTALLDGELVTLVTYTQAGGPAGEHTFIVRESTSIRGIEEDTVSIVDITLISTLLDQVETDLIVIPANVPIVSSDFQARLHYDNGDTVGNIAVDGLKCRLVGLDDFNTSVAGSISTVVLTYYPDTDEPLINSESPLLNSISSIYRLQTVVNELDASFKVYMTIDWNSGTGEYVNTYWLSNLKHDILIKLDASKYTITSGTVNPILYTPGQGVQDIRIAIVINDVLGAGFNGYTYVQQIKVEYGGQGVSDNPWLLDYRGDQSELYGVSVKASASNTGLFPLDLSAGIATSTEWLNKLFYRLHPTYDPTTQELTDLLPTHFRLMYNGYTSADLPLADWVTYHNHLGSVPWVEGQTINIVWLQDDPGAIDHLLLGTSPLMVHINL